MLKTVLKSHNISFASLSEPQIFQCDISKVCEYLEGEYCWYLNSADLHDPDLPLISSRAHGGTLMLWLKELDPYIDIIPTNSTAFLPVAFSMPGLHTSIHVTVYLPTHGKESDFVSDLAELRNCLDELDMQYPDHVLYIRGDSNVNSNNKSRVILLQKFLQDFNLARVAMGHTTYHHFVGEGKQDSDIDILLHSRDEHVSETVSLIICKHEHPGILSHHDLIISTFSVPTVVPTQTQLELTVAPKIDHTRTRIAWSEDGQASYSELVSPFLRQCRQSWLDTSSQGAMSIALTLTNEIMSKCSTLTNKFSVIGAKKMTKSRSIPKGIRLAENKMRSAHRKLRSAQMRGEHVRERQNFLYTKKKYHQTVRLHRLQDNLQRFHKLDEIFAKPSNAYAYIRHCKSSKDRKIEKLTVQDQTYTGAAVCDGFYKSMTALKQSDMQQLRQDPDISPLLVNYDNIIELCRGQPPIPPISLVKSTEILESLKRNVTDYYSITPLHYLHAGQEGLFHFNYLLNALISDVNHGKLEEINTAHGTILYKGHRKDRTSDISYRNLSSCPFLAKSIDWYLRDLYHDCWDNYQAQTQYQGSGSSHELASLLLTEVLQYSLHVSSKPVFVLSLDAQSAFDRCLRQVLCSKLHQAGVPGSAILYIDNRLAHRRTVYEWDGQKMGPATDVTGFEQGGINSSDYYKMYNNEQLDTWC